MRLRPQLGPVSEEVTDYFYSTVLKGRNDGSLKKEEKSIRPE